MAPSKARPPLSSSAFHRQPEAFPDSASEAHRRKRRPLFARVQEGSGPVPEAFHSGVPPGPSFPSRDRAVHLRWHGGKSESSPRSGSLRAALAFEFHPV